MKLKKDNIKFILDGIKKYGDTNLLPKPFEYEFLNHDNILTKLDNWDMEADLKYLVPKSKYGFRNVSILDPIDLILYTTFIFQEIQDNNINVNKDFIYSDIFKEDFSKNTFLNFDYKGFIENSLELGKKYGYVLTTDIAEFFPRLYLHDLERGFFSLFGKNTEQILSKFLKSRNSHETIGVLPVGPKISGLISNITLKDLDDFLIHRGVKFTRYVDDFRIFVKNENEGHEVLYLLTDYLNKRYNLTLQLSKTKIYKYNDYKFFLEKNFINFKDTELYNILINIDDEEFNKKLNEVNSYEEYHALIIEGITKTEKDKILNAIKLKLNEELENEEINVDKIKKILSIGYRYKIFGLHNLLFDESVLSKIYILLPQILKYLLLIKDEISKKDINNIKNLLISLLIKKEFYLNKIPFYKIWILDSLINLKDFLNKDDIKKIINLFEIENDILIKRLIILILGELKLEFWFREKKKNYKNFSSWEKRAFIYGFGQCNFSYSEKKAFKRHIKGTLGKYEYFSDIFLK